MTITFTVWELLAYVMVFSVANHVVAVYMDRAFQRRRQKRQRYALRRSQPCGSYGMNEGIPP